MSAFPIAASAGLIVPTAAPTGAAPASGDAAAVFQSLLAGLVGEAAPAAQTAPAFGKNAEAAAKADADGADKSLEGDDQPAETGDAGLLAQAALVLPLTPQPLVQTPPSGDALAAQATPAGAVTQAQAPVPGFAPAPKAPAASAAATDATAALFEIAPPPQSPTQTPADIAPPPVPPLAGKPVVSTKADAANSDIAAPAPPQAPAAAPQPTASAQPAVQAAGASTAAAPAAASDASATVATRGAQAPPPTAAAPQGPAPQAIVRQASVVVPPPPAAPAPVVEEAAPAADAAETAPIPAALVAAAAAPAVAAPAAPRSARAAAQSATDSGAGHKAGAAKATTGAAVQPEAQPGAQPPATDAAKTGLVQAEAVADDLKIEPAAAREHDAPDQAPQAAAVGVPASEAARAAGGGDPVRGAPQTVANLAASIAKKMDGRSTRFDVELDPIGLGKVDVRIEISAHGKMSASMSCETQAAAAELRSRSGELQKALEQAGFNLSGGLSFDVASGDRWAGQQNAPQQQQQDNSGGWRGKAFQAALGVTDAADETATLKFQRRAASGVDIRI